MYAFIKNSNKLKNNYNKTQMVQNMSSANKQYVATNDMALKTFSLFSQPYLDQYNQCYKNIVVINAHPQGPLDYLVRRVTFPPLSEFKQQSSCNPIKQCGLALMSLGNCCTGCNEQLMIVDEIPDLMSYLISNGYTINTSVTKMFNTSDVRFNTNNRNTLICFVTYNE